MTPEGKVKAQVKILLKKYDCWYTMPVQTGYGGKSLDFICCMKGIFFAIETKAPGKKPTPLQEHTIKAIEEAGGYVKVYDGSSPVALDGWLYGLSKSST